jgi:hypothetical protein
MAGVIGSRFCSICRRWVPKRMRGWKTDEGGAWVCPHCEEERTA